MRISSILMNEIFNFFAKNSYSLWHHTHRSRPILHTKQFWDLVPQNVKEANYLFSFKSNIKKWIPKLSIPFFVRYI